MTTIISEATLRQCGTDLGAALRAIIDFGNGGLPRPTELSRGWKLDQTLCTRLCGALRNEDPLNVLYQMPGPPSIKELTAAATRARVDVSLLRNVQDQLTIYEALIRRVGGKKSNLDTLVGSRVLEAREKIEQRSKQSIFRGMTNLYGVSSEVAMTSYFVYPSEAEGRLNELAVYGSLGMRRLRPELPILVGGRILEHPLESSDSEAREILHRETVEDDGYSIALKQFSTDPFPSVEVVLDEGRLLYTLPGDVGGSYEELTMLFASIDRAAMGYYRTDDQPSGYFGFIPRNPSKHLLLDMFVHESAWQGVEPRLEMTRNDAALFSQATPMDRFDFCENVQFLGTSPSARSVRWVPRYSEMLEWVHRSQGWNPSEFRLYRFAVKHPVISLRYTIYFDLPEAP